MALTFFFGSCKGKNRNNDNAAREQEVMNVDSLTSVFGGEADTFESDAQGGTEVTIFSIGHATMAICAGGKWIYIDANTSVLRPGLSYSAMPKADYMLFTHSHGDHFDLQSVEQLSQESTQIIANPAIAETLGYGNTLHNGESLTTAEGWTVDAVPAYNCSEGKLQFHPQGRDNGYILTVDGFRIYIAGDTEDIDEMKSIKHIDVAFLPCNLPFTMTPDQLKEAAKTIHPKVLFPYHYGQTDIQQVVRLLDGSGIDVRIRQYQ